jgi:ribosomal protein L29
MATDYTKKSKKDLEKLLVEKREGLREIRFASSGSRVRDVKEANKTKKDVARILTALNNTTK